MSIYFNTKKEGSYLKEYCITWVYSCVKVQMYKIIFFVERLIFFSPHSV